MFKGSRRRSVSAASGKNGDEGVSAPWQLVDLRGGKNRAGVDDGEGYDKVPCAADSESPELESRPTESDLYEYVSPKYRRLLQDESAGLLRFAAFRNDINETSIKLLTQWKSLVETQLPAMLPEYIARIVYARDHESYLGLRADGTVCAGMTYRVFAERGFVEIVFVCAKKELQGMGYGERLLAHFKDHMRNVHKADHCLMWADQNAVDFFKLQGFSDQVTLDPALWLGYIKLYSMSTLMQFSAIPGIEYRNKCEFMKSLRMQKKAIASKALEGSITQVVFPGIKAFNQKNAPSCINPNDIPGLKEGGWTPQMDARERDRLNTRSAHYRTFEKILQLLSAHESSYPFAVPVLGIPDYDLLIKNPMDLSTMQAKLKSCSYRSWREFKADFMLIVTNCKTYNRPDTIYVKCANALLRYFTQLEKKYNKKS
ncbi:hypothetical protein DFJ77DRAFT_474651 [Powellomyces hirtus]|nr:hypothetical protein DFJ77DRAFT_474651 [Powellomyces hirtus]